MAEQSTISKGSNKALIGAGLAVAVGAAGFLIARRSADVHDDGIDVSDAPDYVFRRKTGRYREAMVGRTVTINRPKDEMDDTKVGASDGKADPADVARTGWDAMKKGEPAVIHGMKNKLIVAAADVMTDAATAKLHRSKAEPGSASD